MSGNSAVRMPVQLFKTQEPMDCVICQKSLKATENKYFAKQYIPGCVTTDT